MPDVQKRVDRDTYIYQHIGKAVFFRARKLEDDRAENSEDKRQKDFDDEGLPKNRYHSAHKRVCLIKSSAQKQSLGAQPIDQIKQIKKREFFIKGESFFDIRRYDPA